jgi:hypothetical protein
MLRKVALIAAGVLLLGVSSPRADEAVMDQLYGNGVHSYFGGDYSRAYDALSTAIRGGSHDPRAYYFRALAELRLGREPDATADFAKGAALEASDSNGRYSVSQALERIQGSTRATLEQYRENARAVAMQRDVQNRQSVFEQQRSSEGQLLRRAVPPAELTPAPAPDRVVVKKPAEANGPAAAQPGADADPFKVGAAKPADSAVDKAAGEKPIEGSDPFGGDAAKKPPAEAATEPPAKPAEPPAETPIEKPAAKPAEKPADAADPFGGDKPAEKPAEKSAAPDAKASAAATDAPSVKPQPGAVRGIFKALLGAAPGGNAVAPTQGAPAPTPSVTEKPTAGPANADDPFAAPSAASKKSGPAAADASPAVDPSAPTPPAKADPAGGKKAADPFADEPPAKAAPDAKAPAPAAGKSAPEMKKDDDPFKL